MKNKIRIILSHQHFGEILKGSSFVFIYRVIAALITMLLTIELTNRLGAEKSGYYFFIISFLMLLTSLSSFGLFNAVLKEVSISVKSSSAVSNIISRSILLILFGSIVVGILIYLYSYVSNIYDSTHYIIKQYSEFIYIILFPFSLMFLFSSYFQAYKNFFLSMLMMNLGYQLFMLFSIIIFDIKTLESTLNIFELGIFFVLSISVIYYFFKHKNKVYIDGKVTFSYMLSLSTPMMVGHIVSQVNNFSGQFLLSIYSSASDISLFSVVMRLSIVLGFIFIAITRVSTPKFAVLYKENKLEELKEVIIFTNRILFVISIFIVTIVIIFGKYLLSLFGQDFIQAYNILIIVTLGQLIASITGIAVFVLQMTGGEKATRNNIIITTIISIVLGIVIIPIYNLIGAAIMTFTSLSTVNLLACYHVYKRLNINPLKIF